MTVSIDKGGQAFITIELNFEHLLHAMFERENKVMIMCSLYELN